MRKRILAVAGLALATLGSMTTSVQTASAAAIYWSFTDGTGRCLTEYSTGVIRMADCSGGTAQQWSWINSSWNSDYRLLKNRWTGDCLVNGGHALSDDVKSGTCEDWTSRHWKVGTSTYTYILDTTDWALTADEQPNDHVYVTYQSDYNTWRKIEMN
ncbi:hypothetical protein [Streptomyces sp. MI02-7b]|uniref:hypothetical protein n=1 Tax=Streptomyces sp. MI02-7b TaxID=462941 RepID=UPI0029A6378A|nr:hypothetical protein [Streptomyces sp. MI02-7b]MDX3073594.1 hypothetical protein [Streptomyces sp. MI02-7b]